MSDSSDCECEVDLANEKDVKKSFHTQRSESDDSSEEERTDDEESLGAFVRAHGQTRSGTPSSGIGGGGGSGEGSSGRGSSSTSNQETHDDKHKSASAVIEVVARAKSLASRNRSFYHEKAKGFDMCGRNLSQDRPPMGVFTPVSLADLKQV